MKNILLFILALVNVLLLVYIGVGRSERFETVEHRDTITYVDTITYYHPVPKDSTVIKYVSVKLPVVTHKDEAEPTDSLLGYADNHGDLAESTTEDSATVQIPITQKVYEDSTYKAYVSGFRPNLDSIFVYPERQVITINKVPKKPHRWHIGPSVGYGFTPHGAEPFIGVTFSYSIFGW